MSRRFWLELEVPVNSRLVPLLQATFEAARANDANAPAALLLTSLMSRYRRRERSHGFAADTALISQLFGDDAARIRVTRADVGEILDLVVSELGSVPPKSSVLVNLVAATEDEHAVPAIVALLEQFEAPATGTVDQRNAAFLLQALYAHGGNPEAAGVLERWSRDLGEAGDRAREALGKARYSTPAWQRRQRSWRSLDEVIGDAALAARTGWDAAPPILVLEAIFQRAHAKRAEDGDEHARADETLRWFGHHVASMDVHEDHMASILDRVWREAGDDVVTVDPLFSVLRAVQTKDAVPYLIELLARNDARSGCYAAATEGLILEALATHDDDEDVARILASREGSRLTPLRW